MFDVWSIILQCVFDIIDILISGVSFHNLFLAYVMSGMSFYDVFLTYWISEVSFCNVFSTYVISDMSFYDVCLTCFIKKYAFRTIFWKVTFQKACVCFIGGTPGNRIQSDRLVPVQYHVGIRTLNARRIFRELQ